MEDIIARYRNERQDLHEKFTPGKDIASDKVSTQDLVHLLGYYRFVWLCIYAQTIKFCPLDAYDC